MTSSDVTRSNTTRSELLRKLVHISFGAGALLLKWMTPVQAMLLAAAALFFNWFVLPHAGGKLISRSERGRDVGIVLYPVVVLLLIVVFRNSLEIAAAAWMILAAGDGAATVAGLTLRGPRLPWNRDKSLAGALAFVIFGFPAAYFAWHFVGASPSAHLAAAAIVAGAVIAAAFVETLPLHVDDNLTVPATAAFVLYALRRFTPPDMELGTRELVWLTINLLLAGLGYFLRSVDWSGAAGGALLGSALILFGGLPAYFSLLVFFAIGSGATRLGYKRKARLGLAQEKGGRRSFSHAFSNVGVAVILMVLAGCSNLPAPLLLGAAIASLATAAADTTASEIGQWLGRHTFLPLSFRSVPPGTEGAISVEGTVAGALAAFVTASAGMLAVSEDLSERSLVVPVLLMVVSAMAGSWVESVAGSWNRKRTNRVPNGALNFFNTAVGAVVFLILTSGIGEIFW